MALNDTPCPTCGKRCAMMPGITLFSEGLVDNHLFLVCWGCERVRHAQKETWVSLREARQKLRDKNAGVAKR